MHQPPTRRVSLEPSGCPELRRYARVLSMVGELHKAGYQHIRVIPSVAPNGSFWRADITYAANLDHEGLTPGDGKVVRYSTGDGSQFFGWQDAASMNARQLADRFLTEFPEIAANGEGRDWAYTGWLMEVIAQAEQGEPVILLADWELAPEYLQLWKPPAPLAAHTCAGLGLTWNYPSKHDQITVHQAQLLCTTVQELSHVLPWEFDVEAIEEIDRNDFKRIFDIAEYKRFVMVCEACGVVTCDSTPDFPLDHANRRPEEVLGDCDLASLRHYLHSLCRGERWSDGYSSPIFDALCSGALQLAGHRLGTDPRLHGE